MTALRGGARLHRSRAAAQGLRAPDHQRRGARAARPGRQRRQGGVPLRPAGKRQDGDRRGHGPRRSAATCTCRTPSTSTATSSRCSTRSTTSRSRPRRETVERHRRGAARSPLGAHPPAGRHGRRRADARHARPRRSTRSSKFYEAPIQLKANGGVFLVDDFGRQRMRPQDLLNRWIVPLESRVDYLTLHTGKKFQVPFDVLIVFATNLDPESLADEAFLRRIPYKIPIDDPTVDEFTQIFELNCQRREPALPPGDGRVPAAPALRADRTAAARLPSARPARSGHRALPLPRHRAGRSRASCSTPPARSYFVDERRARRRAARAADAQPRPRLEVH